MGLRTPTTNDRQFAPAPAGWAVARCFQVIDLGTHVDPHWDKEIHSVRIGFECTALKRDDGKNHMIFKKYTLSHHPKSGLRKDLESWYGKSFDTKKLNELGGFDLKVILNRAAFLNITHSQGEDTVFANISTIGPMPQGMDCPLLTVPTVYFELEEFNQSVFDSLNDRTKDLIKKSGEYRVMTGEISDPRSRGGTKTNVPSDDDVPYGIPSTATPNSASQNSGHKPAAKTGGTFNEMDDDIPF